MSNIRCKYHIYIRLILSVVLIILFFCIGTLLWLERDSSEKIPFMQPPILGREAQAFDSGILGNISKEDTQYELSNAEKSASGYSDKDKRVTPTTEQVRVYEQKISAIRSLGNELGTEELVMLLDLLKLPYRMGLGVTEMQWDSLKNEVLNKLINQRRTPGVIFSELTSMWSNRSLSKASREYAIQFHILFVERSIKDSAFLADNLNALTKALKDPDLQGTAILGLGILVEEYPELQEEINVSGIARNLSLKHESPYVRSSAIQTLVRLGVSDQSTVASIEEIAINSDDTIERMSAIAALGDLGGFEALRTVDRIEELQITPFSHAAQVAHDKIFERLKKNREIF